MLLYNSVAVFYGDTTEIYIIDAHNMAIFINIETDAQDHTAELFKQFLTQSDLSTII